MQGIIFEIIPEKPQIPSKVLDRASDILSGLGHITFGSIFIPYFLDKFDISLLISGLGVSFAFWLLSLWLAYKI